MGNHERKQSVEVESWNDNDLRDRYPNQWVAIEVTEVTPGVGITKGRVIAHGRKSDEQKVLSKLDEFIDSNPSAQFALFYTGAFIRRGQDIAVASR